MVSLPYRVMSDNQIMLDHLFSELNPNRLPAIVLGQSLGGKLAAENDDQLAGLVSEEAMSSKREIAMAINQGIRKVLPYLLETIILLPRKFKK